jgi:hypothetical protein
LICETEERGLCHLRNDVDDLVQREVIILEVLPGPMIAWLGLKVSPVEEASWKLFTVPAAQVGASLRVMIDPEGPVS